MYENKILVNVYILSLSKNCEIFIPINEKKSGQKNSAVRHLYAPGAFLAAPRTQQNRLYANNPNKIKVPTVSNRNFRTVLSKAVNTNNTKRSPNRTI